jgi:chemotaxis protein methyltransferase CheR
MYTLEPQIDLPQDVFKLLREIIYEYSGIYFDDNSKYFVESRLQASVRRHQFTSFRDYYYYLKYDRQRDDELAAIIDVLTIHETYFFREDRQLKAFTDEILAGFHENRKGMDRTLRIWSAGCSTGEEAYTIAMLILDKPEFKDWHVDILGTDISHRVIQVARRGVYNGASFRSTPQTYIDRYFVREDQGHRINDSVRKPITFSQMNLMDTARIALVQPMDIIFCRNVIIYFDLAAKKKVIDSFHGRLIEGGFLLLGHSESLLNISTVFQLKHLKSDIVYQKGG